MNTKLYDLKTNIQRYFLMIDLCDFWLSPGQHPRWWATISPAVSPVMLLEGFFLGGGEELLLLWTCRVMFFPQSLTSQLFKKKKVSMPFPLQLCRIPPLELHHESYCKQLSMTDKSVHWNAGNIPPLCSIFLHAIMEVEFSLQEEDDVDSMPQQLVQLNAICTASHVLLIARSQASVDPLMFSGSLQMCQEIWAHLSRYQPSLKGRKGP